jgi:hypothetical protein
MPNQITFRKARTVAVAALPDADPRVTPPDPAGAEVDQSQSGEMSSQLPYGSSGETARGHSLYLRFVDGAGAGAAEVVGGACDFQTWVYDPGSTKWVSEEKETGADSSALYTSDLIGTLFVQVSNPVTMGGATHIQVWISDRYDT